MRESRLRRALISCSLVGLVSAVLVVADADPSQAVTTYNDYVVYGENGVLIGGGSDVVGLVGARFNTNAQDEALRLAAQAKITGDARVGEDVFINGAAEITGTLYRNVGSDRNGLGPVGAEVLGDPDLPPVWPPPQQWPGADPSGTVNMQNHCAVDHAPDFVGGGNGGTVDLLVPGVYGEIDRGSQVDLTFHQSGDYFLDRLNLAGGATINVPDPPVRVFVCQDVKLGGADVLPASINATDLYFEVGAIGIAANAHGFALCCGDWIGNVFVPFDSLHWGTGQGSPVWFGYMWAERIDIEHGTTTTRKSRKTGLKFEDANANHQRDPGEPGLPGWTIYVDYNDNGQLDPGEPFDVTDANGMYELDNITPGTWKVREIQQPGWTCTFPQTTDAFGCYYEETFVLGSNHPDNDFGNFQGGGSKAGLKIHDLDADGIWEPPLEAGLPGWVIYVDYNDNGVRDANEPFGVSDANGQFSFGNINPGTWKVREESQAGWFCSIPATTDAFGCYVEETFVSGQTNGDNLFGNYQQARKTGLKFNDLDGNGVFDQGEPGLGGWTIYVDYNDNNQLDSPPEPFAVTAADGSFEITGIQPGTWKVREVQKPGWSCTLPNPCFYEETFTSGSLLTDNLFGNTMECKWCTKGAVLSQVWQNMDVCCAVPDILVDVRMPLDDPIDPSEVGSNNPATGSIQAAIDYVNAHGDPSPGDGEIFIGVTASDCGTGVVAVGDCAGQTGRGPGGTGTENVVVENMNAERLNVFGCSITLNAADASQPVVTVKNGVGKVTVLDIHVQGSSTSGYYVENNDDLVVLKNSRALDNDIGYRINDTNVEVTGSPSIAENRIGIQIEGSGNTVRDNNHINDNLSDGILLTATATGNSIRGNDSDENFGNGIHVLGDNNTLLDNNTDRNKQNGVLADSAEGASGNSLHGIEAETNTLQGIKACGQIDAGDNDAAGNGVNPQIDFVCAPPAPIVPPGGSSPGPGGSYYVPDDSANKVFVYSGSWGAAGSFAVNSNNDRPSDSAVAGGKVYVLDSSDKKIYRYSTAGTLEATSKTLKESGGGSLSSPTALAIDGDQVFVADGSRKKIYRYSLSSMFAGSGSLNAAQQFATPSGNNKPGDIALDATYVYSVDESTKTVFRVARTGAGTATQSRVMKQTGGASLGNPSGAVISGGDLYVSDFGRDKFFRYSLASLFAGSGSLNASAQWSVASGNGDSRGL